MSFQTTIKSFIILSVVFLTVLSTDARAVLYDGWAVVENNSGIAGTIATQLSLDVTDPGNDQVLFTFYNTAVLASSLTDIYIDDGELLNGVDSFISTSGVSFSVPASPPDLPGGNTVFPKFETSSGLSADSDNPVFANGINASVEYLGILFNLQGGKTFADVINAIDSGFNPATYFNDGQGGHDGWYVPTLRVGIHVQGIDDGPWGPDESDTFILTPVPPSVIIGVLGLGVSVLGIRLRKYA